MDSWIIESRTYLELSLITRQGVRNLDLLRSCKNVLVLGCRSPHGIQVVAQSGPLTESESFEEVFGSAVGENANRCYSAVLDK
jgi:hypothetical protein